MLKRWFVSGIVVLVPMVITAYVIGALFNFADKFIGKFINRWVYLYFGFEVPGLGIVFAILILLIVGAIASFARFRVFKQIEKIFLKLPLVKKIYLPIKDFVNFLFVPSRPTVKKVVLIEYPRKGLYSFGFVTNETSEKIASSINRKMLNIFVPSSPSPLTGFTIVVPEKEVIFLDISVEEATKIIVSGGMLDSEESESSQL